MKMSTNVPTTVPQPEKNRGHHGAPSKMRSENKPTA